MVYYYYLLGLKKTNFTGRSSRKAFWFFHLPAGFITAFLISALSSIPKHPSLSDQVIILAICLNFVATFVAGLAITARRLHDIGCSAWHVLYTLIPILSWIAVLYIGCVPSQPKPNKYGAPPKQDE